MSLQDDLFDILEINTEENKESAISHSQSTTATNTTTSSSKAAFDVFLDELLNIPMTSQPIYKPVVTPISTPEEQEEEMWGEFDDDAFFNLSDCSSSNEENKKQKEPLDLTLFGFKTASGKELKPVSEEATRRACALLNEEPLDNFPMSNSNPKSANDNSSINSNSPPANNDDLLLAKNDPPVTFSGFKTASGKQLKPISKEAVEKAKALLLEESTNEKARVNTMFTTASGKSLTAPKEEATKWGTTLLKEPKEGTKRDRENEPKKKRGLQDISNVNTMAKRYKQSTLQKVKPFKSPIIRSNIELTKAAIGNRNIQPTRGSPVFDLKVPSNRRKLSSLGKPQQYTRQQLLSKNIPYDIIDMTSSTSRKYIFNGIWGIKQAHKELIDAGALPNRLSLAWVENHYGLIVWKLACQVRSYPDVFLKDWKPEIVLRQLLYRYEREINQGHRPVLKKILEQDDIAAKHMILAVSDIIEINAPVLYNTSSKYRLQLTDGWYQIPACVDLRMERAITNKRLRIGLKLSICGAQLVGDRTAKLSLESDSGRLLSLSANSCLPAGWDARLGYHPRKYIIRSLPEIFDDGGMITALDIIVCRKFPMLYKENLSNGNTITRTAREEEVQRGSLSVSNLAPHNFSGSTAHSTKVRTNMEERRVSGYFKIRICDYCSSEQQQQWATLLLSNANELNHMDITEGSRYRVFFVMPYHPNNKKYPGLHFKTTRMTRWEPVVAEKKPPCYVPRHVTLCSHIHQQDPFLDFDLVVLILQTGPAKLEQNHGRKLWRQRVLVTDQSQSICQIDLRLPVQLPSKGQVIGLANLRFELHDPKYDITCLRTTDESELVLKSSAEYMNQGLKALKTWAQTNQDIIASITKRIHTIIQ